MKADKNTVIGFVLLAILFAGFFYINNQQQMAIATEKKRVEDSLAVVAAKKVALKNTPEAKLDSLKADSAKRVAQAGGFEAAALGTERLVEVENNVIKALFSSRGGQLKQVVLKNYTTTDGNAVVLGGPNASSMGYPINTANNSTAATQDLFFQTNPVVTNANGSKTVLFSITGTDGKSIVHQYTLGKDDYMIDWGIQLNGANQLVSANQINLQWSFLLNPQQKDAKYEKEQSRLNFVTDGKFDYETMLSGVQKSFDKPTPWVGLKQQFFNATVLAKANFSGGKVDVTSQPDSSKHLFAAVTSLQLPITAGVNSNANLQLYFGPNDYNVLKAYGNDMYNMVDLGSGIFSFVKYINRWVIMPVFDFFAKFISNYGWVILLLTLFIRLVTSPLIYSSYLSGAKMKALKPELDKIKARLGDDQQGFAMEQMKLFREAGVNPLGGCIPALLQIPIFFALYSFFNSAIQLRGQSFLWADDLSRYDSIATLPFAIPGFGDHVSLFTLTAVATSFLISIYNMASTPTQDNPMMKYMPYIFPFILLFVFNKLPSALTWYYTVSNVVTLVIQFIIQKFIINHDDILAQIEAKRKQPKAKSKWASKYEEMLDTQKKLQDMKGKKS
ncbi:MAG: membrane protein insertase YidC [Bacteroidetes bacterium]|nr:MAG: membrane protein insertase YidC [Bacteroidota bacterium]TAF93554.1 MAG: membrane protein insertase YidC [Bacteroidota bacterium]